MLAAMDDAVGLVAGKLEAEGLDRDTLVVFLSDNGGHPAANAARNDPLRDQKSTVFEGGIRVPFVVKWTGRIPAGGVYSEPVISLDILPTALAAAGVAPPPRLSLDGVDVLPHITGRTDRPPHETLYWRYGHHRAIRHGRWKLTMPADAPAGLYDLSTDVAESKDLSAAHPEVVDDLARRYAAWASGLEPPRWRDLFMKNAPGPETRPAPSAQD
jgi:arylsulfatase A-like enzyme